MKTALVISVEGKRGHERQGVAVAERLLPTGIVRLPRAGRAPPPDLTGVALVVAAGRQAIAPARAIALGRNSAGDAPVVAALQPVLWRGSAFDLVWSPAHDRRLWPRAANAMSTVTAPSPLTAALCQEAAEAAGPLISSVRLPRVAVLVGGPSRTHRFGPLEADELAARLAAFAATHDVGLMVATSPRTPPFAARLMAERLGTGHAVFDYAVTRDPSQVYAAVLGAARAAIVTSDSIAMLSDVAALGLPTFAWRLPGGKSKYETFYTALAAHGALRWFDGGYDLWTYPALDAAEAIAARLRPRLGLLEPSQGRI